MGTGSENVEIAIKDNQGKILSDADHGEILLRGAQSSRYYWQRDDLERQRFIDSRLLTGDYGLLDSDRYLVYPGHQGGMTKYSGFHYFPAEADLELGQIPGIDPYTFYGTLDGQGIHQHILIVFFLYPHKSGKQ